jgi:hypothetical protein
MACTLTEYLDRELVSLLGQQDMLNYKFMVDIFYERAMNDVNENGYPLNEYAFKIMMMFYTVTMLKIVVLKSENKSKSNLKSKTVKFRTFLQLKPHKSRKGRARGTRGKASRSRVSRKHFAAFKKEQVGGFGAKTTMGLFGLAIWTLWCGFCFYDSMRDFKHITKNPPPMVYKEFPGVKDAMKQLKGHIKTARRSTLFKGRKFNPMDWVRHIGDVAKVIMELIQQFVRTQLENTFKKSLGLMLFDVTNDVGTSCIDNFELIHTMDNLRTIVNILPELTQHEETLMIAYLEKDPMKDVGTLTVKKQAKRDAAQQKFDTIKGFALPMPGNKPREPEPEPEASWSFSGILGGIKDAATGAAATAQTIAVAAYAAPGNLKDWYEKLKYVQEIFRNNPALCMYRTTVSGISLATQKMNSDKALVVELLLNWSGSIIGAGQRVAVNYSYFFWSGATFFLALAAAIRDHDSEQSYKRLRNSERAETARMMAEQQGRLEQQQRQIKGLKKAVGLLPGEALALGGPVRPAIMELPDPRQLPGHFQLAPEVPMNIPHFNAQLALPNAQPMNGQLNMVRPGLPPEQGPIVFEQGPIVFEQENRGPLRRRLARGEVRILDVFQGLASAPFLRFERRDDYNPDRLIYSHSTDRLNYGGRAFEYSLSLQGTIKKSPIGTVIYREGDFVYTLDAGRMIP